MATFVDVSTDEEQILAIVQYISNIKRRKEGPTDANANTDATEAKTEGESSAPSSIFLNECTRLVQESRMHDVLSKITSQEVDTIFSDTNDKEVEGCFCVVVALIRKTEKNATEMAQKLRSEVISNTTDRPSLRIKILTTIYHVFDNNQTRFDTFLALVKYAQDSGNPELIIPKFKLTEKWLADSGASIEQTRSFYKIARQILKDNNRILQAHKINMKYLQSFSNEESTSSESVELGSQAVVEALLIDDLYTFDHLLDVPSVKALEKDSKHSVLFQFLKIFVEGKLDSFQSFVKQNPSFLQSIKFDQEHATHKIRLLSLTSLASEQREINYSTIATTLQISEDDVEDWVINAVSAKLIEVKMNQIKRTVTVSSSVQRGFSSTQWATLASQLKKWQSSITQLLQVVHQIQTVQSQM